MNEQQFRSFMEIMALVFFNIFCILGIVVSIMAITFFSKIKRKTSDTLDIIQATSLNIHDAFGSKKGGISSSIFGLIKDLILGARR
jgi:hypothetical protein